jgi:hypothetical protein
MHRKLSLIALFVCLPLQQRAHADPIHAVADGAFWHHDSGWVFPEKIGEFLRVGIPQDVAGSKDAVAYYARVAGGLRTVASVDVYTGDSAPSADASQPGPLSSEKLSSEEAFAAGKEGALRGIRTIYTLTQGEKSDLVANYAFAIDEWRVRIRFVSAPMDGLPELDAFVIAQPWETLGKH